MITRESKVKRAPEESRSVVQGLIKLVCAGPGFPGFPLLARIPSAGGHRLRLESICFVSFSSGQNGLGPIDWWSSDATGAILESWSPGANPGATNRYIASGDLQLLLRQGVPHVGERERESIDGDDGYDAR